MTVKDIADGQAFPWQQVLKCMRWGFAILPNVCKACVVWIKKENKPGFLFITVDHKYYLVHVSFEEARVETL